MHSIPDGQYVTGYVETDGTDSSTPFGFVDANGVPRPLKKGERIVITSVIFVSGTTATTMRLFTDRTGAGVPTITNTLAVVALPASATFSPNFLSPLLGGSSDGAFKGRLSVALDVPSNVARVSVAGWIIQS